MSLQTKVISLILFVFLAYGALDYGVQHLLILPSFQSLEEEEALKNMDRAVQAIEQETQNLVVSATDWSVWDDTYQFVQDQNEAFREATLNNQALESLRVNLLYIFNTARQSIWGKMYDIDKREEIVLPGLLEQLAASPLIYMTEPESQVKGFLVTALGPMLIVAKPILTSSGQGPVHGTLLLGRFLNTTSIAEQTLINLNIIVLKDEPIGSENAAILAELGGAGKTIIRNGDEVDRVYRVLTDLFEKPALLLQVDVPKTISARGKTAIRFATISLFGAGLAILGVFIIGLRHVILVPLRLLTGHAVSVGRSDNLSARLALNRQDELGRLAREFDRMVERLAEARKALVEQSYHSGVAEMASGVLHNIGNAITPLSVKLNNLKDHFLKASVAEMDMAVAELADPATPVDRRADMSRFLELAAMELADVIKRANGELKEISKHVDHIQQILADQQRFSRAQRVIEILDLSGLVAETVDLLPETVRKSINVELDPSMGQIGKVQSARIALQQIISNILINASESIFEKGQDHDTGLIRIHATQEFVEGILMAHLCIEDNGIGIPTENLLKIFDRGFSTKARGSGLGLHWSANTIIALKGRIYAESRGAGMGAVLHILLPLAHTITEKQEIFL